MDIRDTDKARTFSSEEFEKENLFETERMFTDVYCFEPGQEQEAHVHDSSDKVYYVLEGEGIFVVGDEKELLSEGEAVIAEAGDRHGVKNTSSQKLRVLVFMAPHPAHLPSDRGHGGAAHPDHDHGHSHDHGHGHDHGHDDGDHRGSPSHSHSTDEPLNFGVLTVSSSRDKSNDVSGSVINELVDDSGHEVVEYSVVDDDESEIAEEFEEFLDSDVDAVVTTGGTGLTDDDLTVEVVRPYFDKEIPGFGEHFRRLSVEEVGTPAILSRATAGTVDDTAVFVLPGSENAAYLGVNEVVLPEVGHVVGLISD